MIGYPHGRIANFPEVIWGCEFVLWRSPVHFGYDW
jgi:hypothetical protein